jgi:hypothetical protein
MKKKTKRNRNIGSPTKPIKTLTPNAKPQLRSTKLVPKTGAADPSTIENAIDLDDEATGTAPPDPAHDAAPMTAATQALTIAEPPVDQPTATTHATDPTYDTPNSSDSDDDPAIVPPPTVLNTLSQKLHDKFQQAVADKRTINLSTTPTPAWLRIAFKTRSSSHPFSEDDIFGENGSLHDLALKGKNLYDSSLKCLSPEQWTQVFTISLDPKNALSSEPPYSIMKTLAIRLAKTDPNIFGTDMWNSSTWTMTLRNDTNAWLAANSILGFPWNKNSSPDVTFFTNPPDPAHANTTVPPIAPPAARPPPAATAPDPRVTTKPSTATYPKQPSMPPPIAGIFLSKPQSAVTSRPQGAKASDQAKSRKYATFFKVRLPKLQQDNNAFDAEISANFAAFTKLVFGRDASALILPWKYPKLRALNKSSVLPTTRSGVQDYVDRLYAQTGFSPWCRFLMAHNSDPKTWLDDVFQSEVRSRDMNLNPEKLQVANIACAGWLLGSHPATMNLKDMEQALSQHPLMRDIPIELRNQSIKLNPQEKIDPDQAVKAVHVYTDFFLATKCRQALNSIYGSSSRKETLPLGKLLRFVPNIADGRYLCTTATRSSVVALKSKQKRFLAQTKTMTNYTIRELDYVIPELKLSLRAALTYLRSASNNDRNLLISVDNYTNSPNVVFVFHQDVESEARTIIPLLPIVLEAELGPLIWQWFTDEAKDDTRGFYWDPDDKQVKSVEESGYAHMVTDQYLQDNWGDNSDIEDETEDNPQGTSQPGFTFNFTTINPRNEFRDNGSVKTFRDHVNRPPLSDHPDSVSQGGQPSINTRSTVTDSISFSSAPAPSTLTNDDMFSMFAAMMSTNPAFKAQMMDFMRQPKPPPPPPTAKDPAPSTLATPNSGTLLVTNPVVPLTVTPNNDTFPNSNNFPDNASRQDTEVGGNQS